LNGGGAGSRFSSMNVVLSPHLDDAVLSCWHLLGGGRDVSVVNVFTGSPDSPGDYWWDQLTGATDSVVRMRERIDEDRQALSLAGLRPVNLGFLDHQYRPDGEPTAAVVERLRAQIPAGATVYAPAALSEHPDHMIVRSAALELAGEGFDVRLYADLPHDSIKLEGRGGRDRSVGASGPRQGARGQERESGGEETPAGGPRHGGMIR